MRIEISTLVTYGFLIILVQLLVDIIVLWLITKSTGIEEEKEDYTK